MAPFRPSNLNKRAYPGNASVIGPTRTPTLGLSTTTCFSTTNVCCPCCLNYNLGCRCGCCACPCFDACCSFPCTVCTPIVPSGMWSSSEQYELSKNNLWTQQTSSSGACTLECCVNIGTTCAGAPIDFKGFMVCRIGDNGDADACNGYFLVSPTANQCCECFKCICGTSTLWNAISAANSNLGSCGWFIPDSGGPFVASGDYGNAIACKTYWDAYCTDGHWTSSAYLDSNTGTNGRTVNVVNGNVFGYLSTCVLQRTRPFRCMSSNGANVTPKNN
jgi:hypothetical protein